MTYRHFFNRAAFGASPSMLSKGSIKDHLKRSSGIKMVESVKTSHQEIKPARAEHTPQKLKEIKKRLKDDLISLNTTWVNQMSEPSVAIREKMVLFWHDHFACRTRNPFLAQQQNNTIRKYALGKFSDLLLAVSKDPAMLQFLNNQQNKKDSPNENFARELMELFTIGRGNYTEGDIKNAARAFTGWAFNPKTGEFVFRNGVHDGDTKIFRGHTGNFSGEDIISLILEDRNTAKFIAKKVWKYFVHPELIDNNIIEDLSQTFYSSGYDIAMLMENIFATEWFYDAKYVGTRIKSPIELIVGMMVHMGGKLTNPTDVIFLQKALGQVLFHPPNVGGWPSHKEWIDSSSLMFRMSLPAVLLRDSEIMFQAKDDGDVNNVTNGYDKARKISFEVDWPMLTNKFMKQNSTSTVEAIEDFLLPTSTLKANRESVYQLAVNGEDDTGFVRKAFMGFMSLPDYQLS